jgi:hypothetical protein
MYFVDQVKQMQKQLVHTGSFENYLDPVYDKRDSLTEQRGSRGSKKLNDERKCDTKGSSRRISDQVKIPSNKNLCVTDSRAPINKNSESYKRKMLKKKKKTNGINYGSKGQLTSSNISQNSRTNDAHHDYNKENFCANEQSSKRYSEVLFKDAVFDSKDDSISGINELNLLQELTNFTNMKMLKNNKVKQRQQHCIHFDRIIKN